MYGVPGTPDGPTELLHVLEPRGKPVDTAVQSVLRL